MRVVGDVSSFLAGSSSIVDETACVHDGITLLPPGSPRPLTGRRAAVPIQSLVSVPRPYCR